MLEEHGAGAIFPIERLGRGFHKSLWLITLGVLLLCIGEMIYAHAAASTYLLKDGAEWAYDVAYFGLAALSFGRGETTERRAAFALAAILGIGGCQGLYEIWSAITAPTTDEIDNLTISAVVTIWALSPRRRFCFGSEGVTIQSWKPHGFRRAIRR